jgi:hypothetical protein
MTRHEEIWGFSDPSLTKRDVRLRISIQLRTRRVIFVMSRVRRGTPRPVAEMWLDEQTAVAFGEVVGRIASRVRSLLAVETGSNGNRNSSDDRPLPVCITVEARADGSNVMKVTLNSPRSPEQA